MLYVLTFLGGAITMLFVLFVVAKIKLKRKEQESK